MPSLRANNNIECIKFNAGAIPGADSLIDRWLSRGTRMPPLLVDEAPNDPESRLAWIINCYGHHYARSYAYHRFRPEPVPEIDTWVIGKPCREDAKLGMWFDNVPASYRLLIHRSPPAYEGGEHPAHRVWDQTYTNLGFKTGRSISKDMRDRVRGVLGELLDRYSIVDGDPRAVIDSLGHEYGYSNAIAYK